MDTNVIVCPETPNGNRLEIVGGAGSGQCNFQCLRSPVRSGGGATSCPSCVNCQLQDQQQQHHYHEIGQNPVASQRTTISPSIHNQTSDSPANLIMSSNTPCCCGGSSVSAPFFQPQHRHQQSIPESDSGSLQGPRLRPSEHTRSCRGPVLSSSTENIQSGCESQYGRRKKR